jgi:hypothetical protein
MAHDTSFRHGCLERRGHQRPRNNLGSPDWVGDDRSCGCCDPMGLYESVGMTSDIHLAKFDYLADTGGIRTWTSADSMVKDTLRRKAAMRSVLIEPKG